MRKFYITDKGGNYIEDLDKEIITHYKKLQNVTSIQKLRVLNI